MWRDWVTAQSWWVMVHINILLMHSRKMGNCLWLYVTHLTPFSCIESSGQSLRASWEPSRSLTDCWSIPRCVCCRDMKRMTLCKWWWKRSFDFSSATSWAEDDSGKGGPRGCQGHRRPPRRALAGEGARGATSVFLWEIELSVISHCDSQADHMDNSISRGCVPVRQQAS